MQNKRVYIAIDLKSFYASVECMQRGLDPLDANLVVADQSRTDKTICLAVSPALKSYGIPGRPRLFEVIQQVKEINRVRRLQAPRRQFTEKSFLDSQLKEHPDLELDFVVAPPQMARYIEISTKIYQTYLQYVAAEDIHVYSIDEVFIDATGYLNTYHITAHELAMRMIRDVLKQTGITATAGIGTNLYLSKVAMDIVAKHLPPDRDGVRIAQLDEYSYREKLWDHTPLTDFWRIGHGYAKKLNALSLQTMGDVAAYSLSPYGRDALFRQFGVNAELLIDHAWGYEPCTMQAIKEYGAKRKSLGAGQVLSCPYDYQKALLVVKEMADALSLDLAEKHLVTNQLVLTVGYDRESLIDPKIAARYSGGVSLDHYGRKVPQHARGTANLPRQTASTQLILEAAANLFKRIADPDLLVRRLSLTAGNILDEEAAEQATGFDQLDLFSSVEEQSASIDREDASLEREKRRQQAILAIQGRYGKNAIVKGMNLQEGATMISRNGQIGGHKA